MELFLAWIFVLLTAVVVGYMARQAYTGKRPFLSIRNIFLIGLILFQLTSAASAYFTERFGDLPIGDPSGSGAKFLFIISTFLVLFIAVYELGWFTFGIQRRVNIKMPIPGTGALVTLSIASLITAVFCRVVLADLGRVGILAEIAASAMAAMAAGTATWAWAGHPKNPGLLVLMLLVVASASGVAMFETFTRREIVSVIVGCLWGAYHGGFKHLNLQRAAIPMLLFGLGGFVLVAAFTSTRGAGTDTSPYTERVRRLAEADLKDGAFQLMAGQDAAGNSLWVIENRPEPFPYDPLASLVYFTVHPIPRSLWENKPVGLGSVMVDQSNETGKDVGFSLGPGLVGHIVNDNPWIALPLYAILLGAWLRILDDLLKRFPGQPYVVLPLGIELGEILGLARGELGFFLFRAVAGMICAYFGTILVAKLLHTLGFAFHPMVTDDAPSLTEEEAEAASAPAQE